MIGSTRSRRLGALLAGVALVVAIAGCTVGTTSIPAGQRYGFVACTAGPTSGGSWIPGPGATRLRFEVLSSDATQPLEAILWVSREDSPTFGTVWDGTKSTGPKHVDLSSLSSREFPLLIRSSSLASQAINVKWAFTALDVNGKDVGFTCVG
jgi:hypothetical protein